ncbi:Aldo/keto reductase [Ceraceosorus guamensis]|uniref:Aldo/keto reductase n=1 Tax=Ceraceosorus guamensis TaxID=1522189 RepID=A0A316W0F8_9BASI|nr:Aldo/keto reductase [Ceraceosorus guamensis]PWN42193.1 Aldo/keto reductase [Ceraceosorus guamensis]
MLPSIPDILYGTAWKDTRTTTLVFTAITAGFRGIDTAGQRKHYREELVGQALHQLEEAGVARREEVWLQTKFTSKDGQDLSGPVPYDPRWPVRKQIRHSAFASLRNLHHPSGLPDFAKFKPIGAISPDGKTRPWLDSYLLHSPLRSLEETLQAWQEMELLVQEGWVRHIGFSNVYDSRIWNALLQSINIRPLALQNRWHSSSGHDVSLLSTLSPVLSPNDSEGRAIHYQPFWTLTGNPALLRSEPVVRAAIAHDWTPAQVVYKFVNQGMGIQGLRCCVLTGTTDEKHMRQAVQVVNNRHGEGHLLTVSEVNEIRKQVYGE